MASKRIKRKACEPFVIPMATVYYKEERFLFSKRRYDEEFYPIFGISRGGL